MMISYARPPGRGWDTVTLFARLAARLLEAELVETVVGRPYSAVRRAGALLPRRRGGRDVLLVAAQPEHLVALVSAPWAVRGNGQVAGFVIDSFWDDRIPRLARGRGHFDQLFVTDGELVGAWTRRTGSPTSFLPFGSDVLDRGSHRAERAVDLQRVGRQPESWEADAEVDADARELGLRYAGRPRFVDGDASANQAVLAASMAAAKFTLSFASTVSPAPYTHPTRDYLTGRWLDAVANGAVVAGIAPRCEATDTVLWPGATLELGTTARAGGLAALREAVTDWTPDVARCNHRMALERVDWRWRVAEIACRMGWETPTLRAELDRLRGRISELGAP